MRLLAALLIPLAAWAQTPQKLSVVCKPGTIEKLGLTCTFDEPCPVFLELSDVELVGAKLFLTGNIHTATVTLESVLLASEDLGKTWTEPAARVENAALDAIQFIDFEVGWVSGQLVQSFPRDPFFLITSDGGKTWHRSPISGEARIGAIEKFRFDSRNSGKMLIDKVQADENGMRYELYESMTGGESWSIRQVSPKLIPWNEPTPVRDIRIRADGPTKTYRIERNQAGKWSALASFSISAGDCKPPEPKVVDEPPPPTDEPEAKTKEEQDLGTFVVKSPETESKKPPAKKKKK